MRLDPHIHRNLFLTRMLEDFTNYFKIYDFTKLKIKKALEGFEEVMDEKDFWSKVLDERFAAKEANPHQFQNGQILKFKNFFLTDWTPKIPGLIWSKEGMPRINEFDDEFDILQVKDRLHPIVHPNSKSRRLNSGFGSVRTNPTNNPKDSFAYLGLVSPKYWNTDFGIPAVVSKSVFEEFKSKNKKGAPWIEEAEGILIRDMDLPFNNIISSAIGGEVENNLKSELLKKPHIPRVYVLITSKLSIDLKENDTHPTTTAWTMFKSRRDYGLTYCHFNPYEKGSFEGVSDFLVEYVKRFGGTKIITDYDGLVPRLESTIRIDKDPAKHNQKEFKKVVQEIVERIK